MIIAGDIGGTKTNLALFDKGGLHHLKSYPSQSYSSLNDIVEEYLHELGDERNLITVGCFAIAGPVIDGVCYATNLPWIIEAKTLSQNCHIPEVFLLNDLEANAYSIEILPQESLVVLHQGGEMNRGNRAMVSPGTGLGEAGLFFDGMHYRPFPTEGGHCDFAPVNELQVELYQYLTKKYEHVSYERILAGPGFINLFNFFVEKMGRKVPVWLLDEMREKNHAAVITTNALNGKSALCEEILDLFMEVFGQELGNVALKFMTFGGLYIGGGISPKIADEFKNESFMRGFLNKGRFRPLLEKIPITLVLDDKASLMGAAFYAQTRKIA